MAFQSNAVRSISNQPDDSWKATAFVNLWIKKADGTRAKLGSISLKDSRSFEKAIIERLTTGGDEAVAALLKVLEIDFHRADAVTPVAAVGF